MKSYKHLYLQICAWENIYSAWRKARKGKRGREPAAAFEFDLESNLVQLQRELANKTYRPGPYTSFYIHDPKRRLISAAPFRDRVVHHALCNVIEPLFERRFIFDSYANREGKGTHKALDRCQQFARRFRYVLPLDVRQFFPSIDHAILRSTLSRVIADSDMIGFITFPTHRRLKRRKVANYRRRLKGLLAGYQAGELPVDRVSASVLGWINHARYGDTWGLRRDVLRQVVLCSVSTRR